MNQSRRGATQQMPILRMIEAHSLISGWLSGDSHPLGNTMRGRPKEPERKNLVCRQDINRARLKKIEERKTIQRLIRKLEKAERGFRYLAGFQGTPK